MFMPVKSVIRSSVKRLVPKTYGDGNAPVAGQIIPIHAQLDSGFLDSSLTHVTAAPATVRLLPHHREQRAGELSG